MYLPTWFANKNGNHFWLPHKMLKLFSSKVQSQACSVLFEAFHLFCCNFYVCKLWQIKLAHFTNKDVIEGTKLNNHYLEYLFVCHRKMSFNSPLMICGGASQFLV